MTKEIRVILISFLAFTLLVTAGIITGRQGVNISGAPVSIERVEKVVHSRQAALQYQVNNFPTGTINTHQDLWELMDSIRLQDIEFLVFQGFELVGWSCRLLPVHGINPQYFRHRVVKLDNGWYLAAYRQHGQVLVVALSLLKHEYPYQNQFLRDGFPPEFGLAPSAMISRENNPGYFIINDQAGNFLFGLSPHGLEPAKHGFDVPSAILLALALAALWIFFYYMQLQLAPGHWGNIAWAASSIAYALVTYMVAWQLGNPVTSNIALFSPVHFAMSEWLPSLGHFLVYSFLVFTVSFWFYTFYKIPPALRGRNRPGKGWYATVIIILLLCSILLVYVNQLFYLLAKHSSGPIVLTRMIDMDLVSLVRIIIIALLLVAFLMVFEKAIQMFITRISRWRIVGIVALTGLFMVVVPGIAGYGTSWWAYLLFVITGIMLVFRRRTPAMAHTYSTFLWFAGLFAIYSGIVMMSHAQREEESDRELLIENLSFRLMRDEDPVAEMYLADIEQQLSHDVTLMRLLSQPDLNPDAIRNHLVKFYFFGFWDRYEMQIIPCWPMGNLYIQETGEVHNCYNYFFNLLDAHGHPIPGSDHFHYLDNYHGQVSYFGVFRYFPNDPAMETSLFIQLNSKPFFEGPGYPELLISNSELAHLSLFEEYSYAKYINGQLVKRSGDYVFSNNLLPGKRAIQGKSLLNKGGYSHLIYNPGGGVTLILSRQAYTVSDIFMALSIFFITFFLAGALTILALQWRKSGFRVKLSIQKRIQVSFVLLLLLMLLIVATGTVYYTVQQFKGKHLELLETKVRSVLHELQNRIGFEGPETQIPEEYLNYQLQMISKVFHCDINLYGIDGHLVATSRPEIFKMGLAGLQMAPGAYFNLTYNGYDRYITDEEIGNLEYTSLYMPITGRDGQLSGFINLPYFVGNDELHEEISSVIVTVVNFYLAFSFLVIGFAVFLARQITRPLLLLQDRISRIKLDRLNEKIDYKGEDEIGGLVSEYNRMVDELAVSAEKLARTERELAWREMAKQIAHEIKNPLTPMKLNIQHLQRAWNDKVEDFDTYLKRVTTSLVEQINNLSSIASEFSKFAQMPSAKTEVVNLVEKIDSCRTLFANSTRANITVENRATRDVLVRADGEQLLGVFNNLIKNAIQAIPPNREGKITITINQLNGMARVTVSDNGRGVPEDIRHNLFVPSFTTKTGGKGLGLAIARRIVENAGGRIWFESDEDEGARFHVEIPSVSSLPA